MISPEDRQAEIDKYAGVPGERIGAYNIKTYGSMGDWKVDYLKGVLLETPLLERGSYLDVGCGRGTSLEVARSVGYQPVVGTDIVPYILDAPNKINAFLPDLPFGDRVFDTVTCLDVMEHVRHEDWEESLSSLGRVCARRLVFRIPDSPDHVGPQIGTHLHVTVQPYEKTDSELVAWLPDFDVKWRKELGDHSETWECLRK